MIREVSVTGGNCSISWNELPYKFEAGTPDICGSVGLRAAIKYLEAVGMDKVFSHEKELTAYASKTHERPAESNRVTDLRMCLRNAA